MPRLSWPFPMGSWSVFKLGRQDFIAVPTNDHELEGSDHSAAPTSYQRWYRQNLWAYARNASVKIAIFLVIFSLGAASATIFRERGYQYARTNSGNHHSAKGQAWGADMTRPDTDAAGFDSTLYYPALGGSFYPKVVTQNLAPRIRPKTPLFVPFTRNSNMMRQTILGYISNGWPRQDIIIVDNSGTFDANPRGQLSKDNPFFLDYDLFRFRYGVSILQTPVLLNFAQLQNFMLQVASTRDWPYYFWGHMDVGIQSREDETPYKSFYQGVLDVLNETLTEQAAGDSKWAAKFFAFDNLSLVNVNAWRHIGQWDVFIPYYITDCDAYGRLKMMGYTIKDHNVGYIWDLADHVENPETKFFPDPTSPESQNDVQINSTRFHELRNEFHQLQGAKHGNEKGRNTWQNEQKGGKGEPWTYDPAGFQVAWWQTADDGRKMYEKKWGTSDCGLSDKSPGDAWKDAKDVTHRRTTESYRFAG